MRILTTMKNDTALILALAGAGIGVYLLTRKGVVSGVSDAVGGVGEGIGTAGSGVGSAISESADSIGGLFDVFDPVSELGKQSALNLAQLGKLRRERASRKASQTNILDDIKFKEQQTRKKLRQENLTQATRRFTEIDDKLIAVASSASKKLRETRAKVLSKAQSVTSKGIAKFKNTARSIRKRIRRK